MEELKDLELLLAGKAIFTVQNEETGNRFTYKIKAADNNRLYFVSVLVGADNYNNYNYIGTIGALNRRYSHGKSSSIKTSAQSDIVFKWVWERIVSNTLPEVVKIYHMGKCCRCGRKLTTPESIKSGIGPKCSSKLGRSEVKIEKQSRNDKKNA